MTDEITEPTESTLQTPVARMNKAAEKLSDAMLHLELLISQACEVLQEYVDAVDATQIPADADAAAETGDPE